MNQILLVEDNPGDILLVRKALEDRGIVHDLHVVKDGGAALDFIARMGRPGEAPCPDVMLLDINLAKADGMQILSAFRKHPQCAETPVIVVTSSDAPRDRIQMGELGVARYFRKPSNLDAFLQLGDVVKEVMGEAS